MPPSMLLISLPFSSAHDKVQGKGRSSLDRPHLSPTPGTHFHPTCTNKDFYET